MRGRVHLSVHNILRHRSFEWWNFEGNGKLGGRLEYRFQTGGMDLLCLQYRCPSSHPVPEQTQHKLFPCRFCQPAYVALCPFLYLNLLPVPHRGCRLLTEIHTHRCTYLLLPAS
jgi:hypothetical protein